MLIKKRLALVSTFHDPKGNHSIDFVKKHLKTIIKTFDHVSLVLTDTTSKEIKDFLDKNGIKPIINPTGQGSQSRKNALINALNTPCNYFLHIDFDRLLFWLEKYPKEFFEIIEQVKLLSENDYLVIGRTTKAWNSHPSFQKIPEEKTNKAISKEVKKTIDVTPGCRAFRRRIALCIAEKAKGTQSGVSDTEWPMIAYFYNKANIKTILVDGLSFETELIFGTERAKKHKGEYGFSRIQMQNASMDIINEIKMRFS